VGEVFVPFESELPDRENLVAQIPRRGRRFAVIDCCTHRYLLNKTWMNAG